MLDKIFKFPVHGYLHILGLCILAFGLPMNKVLMSIGAIWGISNLLLEAKFSLYWQNIKKTKLYWWIAALVLLHFIGLLYSENMEYALHDLKIKLPLITVPLVLAARPLKNTLNYDLILLSFLTSIAITSFINFGYLYQLFGNEKVYAFRDISRFGSHIRYSLLIVMAFVICIYFFRKLKKYKIILFVSALWFCYYTFISQVLSGFLSLACVLVVLFLVFIFHKFGKIVGFTSIVIICFCSIFTVYSISSILFPKLPKLVFHEKTKLGNMYEHNTKNLDFENETYIYHNVNHDEVVSTYKELTDTVLVNAQIKYHCVLRYLSSKGLTKDAEGVRSLSKNDIQNIEHGVANYKETEGGLMSRLYALKTEIVYQEKPGFNGVLFRMTLWKIAIKIGLKNALIGVGTGDIQNEFDKEYVKIGQQDDEQKLHSHNQFFTFWICFGIFGLAIFLLSLIHFVTLQINSKQILGLSFILVFIISCLTEDTLETQMGVNFFVLFWSIHQTKIIEYQAIRWSNWRAIFLFPKTK